MHLGQELFIPRREDEWEPPREGDTDEAKQIQSHLGAEEAPRDKEVLPSLRQEMDWPPSRAQQAELMPSLGGQEYPTV